ncbi:TetR/AcrR family transcriptional regulator [Kribbella sp. NPDC056345]|uniref:TetR/AcrR family transcriptional regulator n=1 Tax=Kribbella sp. NPDC056345 TaxID=3345789 RepID=UPI0035DCD3B9
MGLRELKRARTRRLIADTAVELFSEHGFSRTTVEQIAEAAEVGPTTLYRYFPTKEALVLEFFEDCFVDIGTWLREQPHVAVPELLRALVERVLREMEGRPDRVRVTIELAARTPSISAYLSELNNRLRNTVADELVRRLPGSDPRLTAALMAGATVSTIDVVLRFWSENPDHLRPLPLVRQAMTLLERFSAESAGCSEQRP